MLWASTSMQGNLKLFQNLVFPLPFQAQGIEISDQGAGPAVYEEGREGFSGLSRQQKKGDVLLVQSGRRLF